MLNELPVGQTWSIKTKKDMTVNINELALKRYTAKHYDPTRKISSSDLDQLCQFLRNCPSSVNAQGWHFIVIGSEKAKQQILPAFAEANQAKIKTASHVVIFCAKTSLDDAYLQKILDKETEDGRFANEEQRQETDATRRYFIGLNNSNEQSLLHWESKQIYIALSGLLFSAQALGIDSTPIEGFDAAQLDNVLSLKQKGLISVVVAALGYHAEDDFNANLPKSRLSMQDLFTFL